MCTRLRKMGKVYEHCVELLGVFVVCGKKKSDLHTR